MHEALTATYKLLLQIFDITELSVADYTMPVK